MKNTLFNNEIEGYTREKYSNIKLTIFALTLFSAFAFMGWVAHTAWSVLEAMIVTA